jgi:hypothetical protein
MVNLQAVRRPLTIEVIQAVPLGQEVLEGSVTGDECRTDRLIPPSESDLWVGRARTAVFDRIAGLGRDHRCGMVWQVQKPSGICTASRFPASRLKK